jgi:hypothetical protein
MEISHSLARIVEQNVRFALRFGEVTAVATTPNYVSVKISGSSTAVSNVRYLDSYSPTVADIVILLVNKGDIIVLGTLA